MRGHRVVSRIRLLIRIGVRAASRIPLERGAIAGDSPVDESSYDPMLPLRK